MDNYYSLLSITQNASPQDIKKAFREQAKRLHPDIAGAAAAEKMRKLLTAYEVLSDRERRYEYDRAYGRFINTYRFDYRAFLRERQDDPGSQARLVFFNLLHLEEEEALAVWRAQGGLDFSMEKHLDREDWMDCTFILAEELEKRRCYYEAVMLLIALIREERRLPYFRHFIEEVEAFLKEIIRLKLKPSVTPETYAECLEALLELGFSPKDEARWMRSLAETLIRLGELRGAEAVFREALRRDPGLPNTRGLRKKLRV
ncbi:MAG: DnaJ domain-containing protein [Spirochaetaceae bacterium]|jgi:curved DNA-binding protein CbpA|nr:DnaJ domain-containing protein [Spirochaetaceae bacterium]